jgi:siroheme synthase-like protein
MRYYPIFLDLQGRRVLVAGAGQVALRKTRGLLDAGARVTVVAPAWDPEFERLPVRLLRRRFRASDLDGAALAFAATDDRRVNRRIGAEAERRGVPANIADRAEECRFLVPARLARGAVQIAISTGGASPRLAAALRRRLEAALPDGLALPEGATPPAPAADSPREGPPPAPAVDAPPERQPPTPGRPRRPARQPSKR